MNYLTTQHTTPPRGIELDGIQYPVTRLIELEDTATLATLGVVPHIYLDPSIPAPLGTGWEYNDTEAQWEQVPLGTEADRNLAIALQAFQDQKNVRRSQATDILDKVVKILLAPAIIDGSMSDETVAELASVSAFPLWEPNVDYAVGDILTYNSDVVEILQAHTSQLDWTPDVTLALYKMHRPQGVISEWVQPSAENPYMTGDQVTYNGSTWTSTIDNNVWAPGVAGWTENP